MKNADIIFDLISYEGAVTNDPADAIKIKNRISETQIASLSRQQLIVADATTDQNVNLPDASSDYLVILTDQDISIKLNGSGDSISLKARGNNLKTLAFFNRGIISGLLISNASGKSANVDILILNK